MSYQLDAHTDSIRESVADSLRDLEGYVSEQVNEATSCLDEAERHLNAALDSDPDADRSETDEGNVELIQLALSEIDDARTALEDI